jgi:hypothetical protein
MKIDKLTINLHCGCSRDVVNKQKNDLSNLTDHFSDIDFNLRIDRYPKAYPSYSQLMNHAIATSKYEFMIFANDRTTVSVEETLKIVNLLENGFACVYLYNVGYMGFSKELVRQIGWWDERFLLGGWEDRDWTFRLAQSNLALYESQEASYDYSWKSPLQEIGHQCRLSEPHWNAKWDTSNINYITQRISNEDYIHWNLFLGDSNTDIKKSWKSWNESMLSIMYDKPNSGPSTSSIINNRVFNKINNS